MSTSPTEDGADPLPEDDELPRAVPPSFLELTRQEWEALDPRRDEMSRLVASARAVVRVTHRVADADEERTYHVGEELFVEEVRLEDGRIRLSAFDLAGLAEEIFAFVDLVPRPSATADPIELPAASVERLARAGPAPALADLPLSVRPFAEALSSALSSSAVMSVYQEENRIVGGELAWIDGGDAGLWCVEPAEAAPDVVVVTPIDEPYLVRRILAYLPGAPIRAADGETFLGGY
jgi:hypothetical protein